MQETTATTLVEVTALIRKPGESDAQALFAWMCSNRYLWLLRSDFVDQTEELVGTRMVISLAGKKLRWERDKPQDHPARQIPADAEDRERAYVRLERFRDLHIKMDSPPVNASALPATRSLRGDGQA